MCIKLSPFGYKVSENRVKEKYPLDITIKSAVTVEIRGSCRSRGNPDVSDNYSNNR